MADKRRSMRPDILAVGATLIIMYIVPLPIYGLLSVVGWSEIPDEGSPAQFMISVLVVKIGVALGFVWMFRIAASVFASRWQLYGMIWWLMFAIVECGQAIGPNYSWGDALGGIIAEAIYFPLSSWAVVRLLGLRRDTA